MTNSVPVRPSVDPLIGAGAALLIAAAIVLALTSESPNVAPNELVERSRCPPPVQEGARHGPQRLMPTHERPFMFPVR